MSEENANLSAPETAPAIAETMDLPDGGNAELELAQLDALLTSAEEREQPRSSNGQYTASAKDAPRAGNQVKGAKGEAVADGSVTKPEAATPRTGADPESPTPKAKANVEQPAGQPAEVQPESSRYEKAKDREAKTWKQINDRKAELDLKETQIVEREKALRQQRIQPVTRTDATQFTAQDYMEGAQEYTAEAEELEAAGDFDKADERRKLAKLARTAAREARAGRPAAPATGDADFDVAWQQLKTDLPEAMNPSNPMNRQFVELVKANPQILAGANGPLRAAIAVGRRVVQGLEAEKAKLSSEAAQVPVLQQKVTELTAKLDELQRLVSLPNQGTVTNRAGTGSGRGFDQLTVEEQGAELRRELVNA